MLPPDVGEPKVAGVNNWFSELKRRRVFRALIGYGIAAFAVLQIIEPIVHGFHWPETVLSYVVVALAAGFPVVITLAWIFDVKEGHIERTPWAPAATGLRGVRLALLLVGLGVLAAAPGSIYYFVLRGGNRSMSNGASNSASSAASIAVLPFASSSAEENAYFAQGFHDELLRQMGKIGDLRVISRTSVMQYKDGARSLREIAEALGVSSIVEGSVQRAGNRVRVEVRLIDARNDRQMWGDLYDRDVTDVFAIQTAVAEQIAGALHARLSAAQKVQIERKPTQSAEAYDLYLRALEYANRPGYNPDDLAFAERLCRQAIQTDPSFALARARLARVRMTRYYYVTETPRSVAEEARAEAEESLRLQPDLPDGHLALGLYYYWAGRDFDRALKELEIARAGMPSEALYVIAAIARRQGKFDEAIRNEQKAVELDPRSPNTLFELAVSLTQTRRYQEADQVLDRALTIAPDYLVGRSYKALVHELWKGETELAQEVLRAARGWLASQPAANPWLVRLLMHHPREALPVLDSLEYESVVSYQGLYPKAFLYAVVHEALGEAARARQEYDVAVPLLEAQVEKNPGQRILLARAYAGLGRKEDALREARRAVELVPISKDALFGPSIEASLAAVEARVGEKDAAVVRIRYLLSIPCLLSPAILRIDPTWAPLRDDPRFRRLAELDPK